MLNMKGKIVLGSCGVTIAISMIGSVYFYGQYMYNKGKEEEARTTRMIVETLRNDLYKQYNK